MYKRIPITLTIVLLILAMSSVVYATDILASGRTIKGTRQGENDKLDGEPFTLQKEGTLTSIVRDDGAWGFFILRYDSRGTVMYDTLSSTAGIGKKFPPGTYLIYPHVRDGYKEAIITVRFTY